MATPERPLFLHAWAELEAPRVRREILLFRTAVACLVLVGTAAILYGIVSFAGDRHRLSAVTVGMPEEAVVYLLGQPYKT